MRISDLHGNVALVAFWFPTCQYCRAELPQLEPLHQRYSKEGLKVVAIDIYSDRDRGRQFIEENRLSYHFLDGNTQLAADWGVTVTPTMFLIDREGTIVRSFNRLGPEVEREIERLLRQ